MPHKAFKNYLYWSVIALAIIVSFFIIKDFIVPILSAFILAYLIKPVYKIISKKLPNKISSILTLILLIIILSVPLFFLFKSLISQLSFLISQDNLPTLTHTLSKLNIPENILVYLPNLIENVTSYFLSLLSSLITYTPILLLNMIVTIFLAYYFLIDWNEISDEIESYLPFKNNKKIISELDKSAHQIVYGTFLISLLELIISALAFYFLGINFFLILSFLVAILAFIPAIGPMLVWLPLLIIELLQGNYLISLGVLITGIILSFGIDMYLRATIIGGKSKIHPAIILIGILGGVKLFGIFGFIIGPLLLSFIINLIKPVVKNY